jgi:hypothetical protein
MIAPHIFQYFKTLTLEHILLGNAGGKVYFESYQEAKAEMGRIKSAFVYFGEINARLNGDMDTNIVPNLPIIVLFKHKLEDFEGKREAINNALAVARAFLSRMRDDRNQGFFPHFDISAIAISEEHDTFDGFSGLRIMLPIAYTFHLYQEIEDWIQPPTPEPTPEPEPDPETP